MEIIELHVSSDLRVRTPEARPAGDYTYHINTRQFSSVHRAWQNNHKEHANALAIMTLEFQCIWMTPAETAQVATAIKELTPRVTLSESMPADAPPAAPM